MRNGNLSIKEFYATRNKILFISDWGGLGDIIIHRMCLADVKRIMPDAEIHFCCLDQYLDAIKDHPFISKFVRPQELKKEEYLVFYQTDVKVSNKYESFYGIKCKLHRSDIWALSCGYELEDHNMYFNLNTDLLKIYQNKLEEFRKKKDQPIIIFSPDSAIKTKCLTPHHLKIIDNYLRDFNVVVLSKKEDDKYGFQTIKNTSLTEWLYYTASADYVISVDTATFHLAGGLKKPLLGIFTFANGKTYGKYYNFVLVQKHFDSGKWDCGPCYNFRTCPKTKSELKPCLTEISEEEIKSGIDQLFVRWPWKNKIHLQN
jgi:ADP-heptose:LPS heptosyltransferase